MQLELKSVRYGSRLTTFGCSMNCFYCIQHIHVGKYRPCRLTVPLTQRILKQKSLLVWNAIFG